MNELNMAFSRNTVLFTSKKGGDTDTCHNAGELVKRAEREKSVLKGHLLCGSIYSKCPAGANPER